MKRLEEFRIYYNHTIHPELRRMERRRLRLVGLVFISALLFTGLLVLNIYLNLFLITLLFGLLITFYISYLLYQIRQFILTFKPHVMNLVLDFIDDGLNFDPDNPLQYEPKQSIPKERFLASRIFATEAPFYEGEDYILGKVGELDFELSELYVQEYSPVLNKLNVVFKGIFLHAVFNMPLIGEVVAWPRDRRQFLTRSLKAANRAGFENADHEIMHPDFQEHFITYATADTHVAGMIPLPLQEAIIDYCREKDKELYFSFLNRQIYIAVSEPKDILEPFIFRSNLSFELVREFFEDISLLIRIVEDFDQSH